MKYKIQHHNDHNVITIHLDLDLLKFLPRPNQEQYVDSDTEFWDEEEMAPNFLKRLLRLKGVVDVEYDRYSVDIFKGELFSWKKVIRAVIADLETVLNMGERAVKLCHHQTSARRKKSSTARHGTL